MNPVIWTKEQDDFLKKNLLKMTRKEMAKVLNIGFWSVYHRMRKLGLKRNKIFRESLIGKRFGKFIVIKFIKTKERKSYFEVKCDCGTIKILQHTQFTCGSTSSCGCKSRDNVEFNQYMAYYKSYKRVAQKRGLGFNISFEFFKNMIIKNCHYCGSVPRKIHHPLSKTSVMLKNVGIFVNGIDRMEQNIGYTKTNCVPCCPTCNFMKQEHCYDIFLSIISKIYNNRNLKNKY